MKSLILAALAAVSTHAATTQLASLSWTAPTTNTDGTPVTGSLIYNIYQAVQGATLAKVQSGITGTSASITTGLTAGTTQCFAVTSVEGTSESAQSAPVCTVIPLPVPNAPTNLVVK